MDSELELKRRKGLSANEFIDFLCLTAGKKESVLRKQMSDPAFIAHCKEVYNLQDGKCAFSNIPMALGWADNNPQEISIDLINPMKSFEIGNVRLVIKFFNKKQTGIDYDSMLLDICRAVVVHHEKQQC